MKIGLVIEHVDPHRGGAEQWTCQMASRLLARGHEVHIVTKQGTVPIFAPAKMGLSPSDISDTSPILHHLAGVHSRLAFAATAETVLKRLSLDVIHDMGGGWHCDVLQSHDGSRLAQWQQKIALLPRWARPVKRAMIALLPRYHAFRKLMARQYTDPQRIIVALSQMCADDYRRFHNVPPERIRLVYNGVDTERFSPACREKHRVKVRQQLGSRADDLLLLFVGRDFRRKGLATAIRAVGRLVAAGKPVRLAVLGGTRPGAHARLADACRATDAVAFAGGVADSVPYYAAADALVLPTFYDPCSLSVLEAAASGIPSATTRFNGAGELLTEGVDGFVLDDPADDRHLAGRLQELLDPARRRRMGEAARQLALQHTLDRNCDEMLDVYRDVMESRLVVDKIGGGRATIADCKLQIAN
jgi:UDP-glucose:(heptosyl)LPS alpha-1,3-glucosyltransferase